MSGKCRESDMTVGPTLAHRVERRCRLDTFTRHIGLILSFGYFVDIDPTLQLVLDRLSEIGS